MTLRAEMDAIVVSPPAHTTYFPFMARWAPLQWRSRCLPMPDPILERSLIANPPAWPNGARCAVALTFDVDTDSMIHYSLPETAHTKLTCALVDTLRPNRDPADRRVLSPLRPQAELLCPIVGGQTVPGDDRNDRRRGARNRAARAPTRALERAHSGRGGVDPRARRLHH